ncbi:hypothetical protein [Salinivibrio kushneri]|uniref:Uncharacterized protein n=1 Tax=Salinivibrio kushneri TaxID=1908198 RepID=A0AB36JXI2_9GAMM|nr:hypothetical protein [Salinivibrio kushneri]OOE39384.1 hypothetical protein BZG09_16855 [Salinivibrio kushneri]
MNFNFKESLAKGQASAYIVEKNHREVKTIYNELINTLSEYFEFEVELHLAPEYKGMDSVSSIAAIGSAFQALVNPERVSTGYTMLMLGAKEADVNKVTLLRYQESDDVYPITVLINKDKILCYNQEEYAAAISKALESSKINLELIGFKNQVEQALQESSKSSGSE